MTTTHLIESPDQLPDSDEPLAAGLPPLLSRTPVAGPPVFVLAAFGVVLLLLLVPPLTLLVTVMLVPLLALAAVVAVGALVGAILAAPVVAVRRLRGHALPHVSLPVPHLRHVKTRRV